MDVVESNIVDLKDGYCQCDNIRLPEGELYSLYIADSGIFAIAQPLDHPRVLYLALRDLLGTAKLRMYVIGSGLYDFTQDLTGPELTDSELTEKVNAWIFTEPSILSTPQILNIRDKLLLKDALCRGEFVDLEGNVFILHRGKFVSVASMPSDRIYYIALFGGILGLHRFACGKIFSGFVYLFTGGLFTIGWFLDVLALLCGVFKDHRKRYLMPLKNRFKKLLWLPAGAFVSLIIFGLLTYFASLLLAFFNAEVSKQVLNSDIDSTLQFKAIVEEFFNFIHHSSGA